MTYDTRGTKYKFFDLEGVPVRMLAKFSVPEILRRDGKWEPYTDTIRFIDDAAPVSKKEFDKLCKEWLSFSTTERGGHDGTH
jgi:hypothetical protein